MQKILIILLALCTSISLACTHFRLIAKDGSVIVGRSMEFGPDMQSQIYTVNRDTAFSSTTPDGKPGLTWKAKYGYLAINGFHLMAVSGINEKGLSIDLLYFPGYAKYADYKASEAAKAMPYYQMSDYVLSNFDSVAQIKAALPALNVYAQALTYQGSPVVFPVHYVATDAQGHSVVIEMTAGGLHVYNDASGILTNSPGFPWQVDNLSNYINLSPFAPNPIVKDGITYNGTGQGSGAVGLPGDFTPPSRFVKIAFLVSWAMQQDTAAQTVNLAQHILNGVDIPYGVIRGPQATNTAADMDKTQWAVIKDLTHKVLYFRSYHNLALQKIDMSKLNFAPGSPALSITLANDQPHIVDVTSQFMRAKAEPKSVN